MLEPIEEYDLINEGAELCAADTDKAIDLYERKEKNPHKREEKFLALAKRLLSQRIRILETLELLGKLNERYPKTHSYAEMLGKIHYSRKQFDAAEKYFKINLQRRKQGRDIAHNYLGISHLGKEEFKEAQQQFELALEENSQSVDALTNMGLIFKKLGDFPRAIEFYDRAAEIAPNDSDVLNNIGALYYAQNNYSDAIVNYLKALEVTPQDGEILCNLGNALVKARNLEYAWLAFEEALRLEPENRTFIDQYLLCLLKVKNFEKFNRMLSSLTFLDSSSKKRLEEMGNQFKRAADKDAIKYGLGETNVSGSRDSIMRRNSVRQAIASHRLQRRMTSAVSPDVSHDSGVPHLLD